MESSLGQGEGNQHDSSNPGDSLQMDADSRRPQIIHSQTVANAPAVLAALALLDAYGRSRTRLPCCQTPTIGQGDVVLNLSDHSVTAVYLCNEIDLTCNLTHQNCLNNGLKLQLDSGRSCKAHVDSRKDLNGNGSKGTGHE